VKNISDKRLRIEV